MKYWNYYYIAAIFIKLLVYIYRFIVELWWLVISRQKRSRLFFWLRKFLSFITLRSQIFTSLVLMLLNWERYCDIIFFWMWDKGRVQLNLIQLLVVLSIDFFSIDIKPEGSCTKLQCCFHASWRTSWDNHGGW